MDDEDGGVELDPPAYLRNLADRLFHNLSPSDGFDQYDSDRLYEIAQQMEERNA